MILKTLARGLSKLRNDLKTISHKIEDTKILEDKVKVSEAIGTEFSIPSDVCNDNDVIQDASMDIEKHLSDNLIIDEQTEHNAANELIYSNPPEELKTTETLAKEIDNIYEKAVDIWGKMNTEYPSMINNHIVDTYLKVLCSVPATKESYERALSFFREKYADSAQSLKGQGYFSLLAFVIKSNDAFKEYGPSLWTEFLEWDNNLESNLLAQKLTEVEKEQIRVTENRDRDSIFMAFIWMVRGYTRVGNNEEAVAILKNSQEFRSLDYLRPIFFRDIWVLVKRARDESEDGKWKLAQELSAICSNSTTDPLQAVQRSMKQKMMPQNWWGWQAVGIDEVELKRLTKKNKRINQKARQIADSKRPTKHRK